ncbi:MAG: hypothetical protein ACYCQJ_02940 [Nitrososphaerales archaeon]
MKAIADTSSVIYPAKVSSFWKVMKDTFEEILIPEAVHEEILRGKEFGSSDVPIIERAIDDGWLIVAKMTRRTKTELPQNLGEGEKQAITLMLQSKAKGTNWLVNYQRIYSLASRFLD